MAAQPRAPRRLNRTLRREQLIAAAIALSARHGFAELSLEALAGRAGVTRNLLYHYFPRGRPDVVLAVVEAVEQRLIGDWSAESRRGLIPGLERILDHALAPTHAWRVHRLARASPEPAVAASTEELVGQIVMRLAVERGLTAELSSGRLTALRGYVAFVEATLDEARRTRLPRDQILGLLCDTLHALPVDRSAGPGR